MRQLVLLYGIVIFSLSAWSATEVGSVTTKTEGEAFQARYSLSEPMDKSTLQLNYRPRSVELVFPGSTLKGSKNIVRVDHKLVDRVYTAARDGRVFSRVILKPGLKAEDYKDWVSFDVKDDQVQLLFKEKLVVASPTEDIDQALDREVAKILSKDLPEKQVQAESEPVLTDQKGNSTPENLKESEIPVLTDKAKVKEVEKSPYSRLVMSLVVIALFAGAMALVGKWWKKKTTKNTENNKIRLVTQHFLGPRKSLAIIRVAGETMLIGVTDHNISMIKSLALLDDSEIENIDPSKSFGDVLQKKEKAQAQDEDDFAFAQIKDQISSKIKEMRPL